MSCLPRERNICQEKPRADFLGSFPPSIGWESKVPTRSSLAWDNKGAVEGIGGDGWKRGLCTPGLASVCSTEKVGQWHTGLFGQRVLAIWSQKHDPSFQSKVCRAIFHRLRTWSTPAWLAQKWVKQWPCCSGAVSASLKEPPRATSSQVLAHPDA